MTSQATAAGTESIQVGCLNASEVPKKKEEHGGEVDDSAPPDYTIDPTGNTQVAISVAAGSTGASHSNIPIEIRPVIQGWLRKRLVS